MSCQTRPIEERFWKKVDVNGPCILDTACWLWTGCKNKAGYGSIGLGGKAAGGRNAHRVSWELHFGSIPKGFLFVINVITHRVLIQNICF